MPVVGYIGEVDADKLRLNRSEVSNAHHIPNTGLEISKRLHGSV